MNYRLFHAINGLAGNSVVDAVMKAAAKYLIVVVFAVAAVLCVQRGQIDSSARLIRWFELAGWAANVRWPNERRLTARRAT